MSDLDKQAGLSRKAAHSGLHAQMALGLSAEQKERLLAARSYLLAQMLEIISERTAIINMLQARTSPPVPLCPLITSPTSSTSLAWTPLLTESLLATFTTWHVHAAPGESRQERTAWLTRSA
jgi:hypothetical protein